jgi:hypothetical protein
MAKITDEFEIADDISLEDIKKRVNSWFESSPGNRFVLEREAHDHITLKRAKYRLWICSSPLWVILIGPIYLVSMNITSINAGLGMLFIFVLTTVF